MVGSRYTESGWEMIISYNGSVPTLVGARPTRVHHYAVLPSAVSRVAASSINHVEKETGFLCLSVCLFCLSVCLFCFERERVCVCTCVCSHTVVSSLLRGRDAYPPRALLCALPHTDLIHTDLIHKKQTIIIMRLLLFRCTVSCTVYSTTIYQHQDDAFCC